MRTPKKKAACFYHNGGFATLRDAVNHSAATSGFEHTGGSRQPRQLPEIILSHGASQRAAGEIRTGRIADLASLAAGQWRVLR